MLFLIAIIPALFVYWVSTKTNSHLWTAASAILSGVLGFVTGDPALFGVDMLCVAIATYISHHSIQDRLKKSARQANTRGREEQIKAIKERGEEVRIARLNLREKLKAMPHEEVQEFFCHLSNDGK